MLLKAETSIFVVEGRSIRDGDKGILQVSLTTLLLKATNRFQFKYW